MRVEVDDSDGTVGLVHAAQEREGDGVVSTHGDDTGESLALDRGACQVGVVGGFAHEDAVVALLDLLDGPLIVVAVTV